MGAARCARRRLGAGAAAMKRLGSWGRVGDLPATLHLRVQRRDAELPPVSTLPVPLLPYGRGRSYGDVCQVERGTLLHTAELDRFVDFDPQRGVLQCESGLSLGEILRQSIPRGWTLPVLPGTGEVTVGGAIANDVHGRNHPGAGSFGHHVEALELLRSDGTRLLCSAGSNPDWFAATIGGLGLTGLITWASLRLRPVANAFVHTRCARFRSLDEFWELSAAAQSDWPYARAWIDGLARGRALGRGVLVGARDAPALADLPAPPRFRAWVPPLPWSLLGAASVRMGNAAYWSAAGARQRAGVRLTHYERYFFAADRVAGWNRLYGPAGFHQYQCALPERSMREATQALLGRVARSGQRAVFGTLQRLGDHPAPGMLSFARAGATLALDFAHRGEATLRLFTELDAVVRAAGGALYPAKDSRMPPAMFRAGFPRWEAFGPFVDPAFGSAFWRRVSP